MSVQAETPNVPTKRRLLIFKLSVLFDKYNAKYPRGCKFLKNEIGDIILELARTTARSYRMLPPHEVDDITAAAAAHGATTLDRQFGTVVSGIDFARTLAHGMKLAAADERYSWQLPTRKCKVALSDRIKETISADRDPVAELEELLGRELDSMERETVRLFVEGKGSTDEIPQSMVDDARHEVGVIEVSMESDSGMPGGRDRMEGCFEQGRQSFDPVAEEVIATMEYDDFLSVLNPRLREAVLANVSGSEPAYSTHPRENQCHRNALHSARKVWESRPVDKIEV